MSEVTPEMLTDETLRAVDSAVQVSLGRDAHLEHCGLARKGGPDATLACAYCGRARWMHSTRHDTCGQFCYVHESTITDNQIIALRHVPSLPHTVKVDCSRALNEFGGLGPVSVRDAKRSIASFVNDAKRKTNDAINARSKP